MGVVPFPRPRRKACDRLCDGAQEPRIPSEDDRRAPGDNAHDHASGPRPRARHPRSTARRPVPQERGAHCHCRRAADMRPRESHRVAAPESIDAQLLWRVRKQLHRLHCAERRYQLGDLPLKGAGGHTPAPRLRLCHARQRGPYGWCGANTRAHGRKRRDLLRRRAGGLLLEARGAHSAEMDPDSKLRRALPHRRSRPLARGAVGGRGPHGPPGEDPWRPGGAGGGRGCAEALHASRPNGHRGRPGGPRGWRRVPLRRRCFAADGRRPRCRRRFAARLGDGCGRCHEGALGARGIRQRAHMGRARHTRHATGALPSELDAVIRAEILRHPPGAAHAPERQAQLGGVEGVGQPACGRRGRGRHGFAGADEEVVEVGRVRERGHPPMLCFLDARCVDGPLYALRHRLARCAVCAVLHDHVKGVGEAMERDARQDHIRQRSGHVRLHHARRLPGRAARHARRPATCEARSQGFVHLLGVLAHGFAHPADHAHHLREVGVALVLGRLWRRQPGRAAGEPVGLGLHAV
mmetsp:Transcript_102691/g.295669  ORF Transcript_102691/g.295669 Transcript_102691/m.295669 type:complete len:523 (+) Transcript_102691:91-1659(+)